MIHSNEDGVVRDALPEGEERPPPGTRTAAIVRWALVALMALAAVGAWTYHATSSGLLSSTQVRYHCPMHPTIVQSHKGECPICGMDLVPVTAAETPAATAVAAEVPPATPATPGASGAPAAAAGPRTAAGAPTAAVPIYACPVHPSLTSGDPDAKCPVCGTKMVAKSPAAAAPSASAPAASASAGARAAAEYTCPMHPSFVTTDPKARCPQCGMKLVPRGADASAQEAVPGLSPVDLSADRIQLIGMKTAVATRRPLPASIRTPAFVAPPEGGVVSVTARYTGWLESIAVDETGRAVQKGDVLARVYSPDLTAALQSLTAAAKWSGRAAGGLGAPTIQGDAARDARLRVELLGVARQDVDAIAASGEVPQTVPIRSPVRGYVARKSAVRGAYVTPGSELFQIADLSSVWAVADIYEGEIGRVRVGQRATLELPAWPGERFEGRISFVSPALAAGSRTLQARIELRNPGLKLRPGMYGDVRIDLGDHSAVTIPADALIDTGELQYVFVSRGNGRFEPRRVRAGWRGGGEVAVLSGLADGERVVTTANFLLDSESRLRAAIAGFGASAPHDEAAEPPHELTHEDDERPAMSPGMGPATRTGHGAR